MKIGVNAMARITGKIPCKKTELDLGITLKGGQSFRWTAIENDTKYRGVFSGEVWTLHQDNNYLSYTAHKSVLKTSDKCEAELIRYFNLHISLEENIKKWSNCDINFKNYTNNIEGVRILNQDVVENLFSFICSANNNITRITSMIEKLCRNFGKKICQIDKQYYYDFPTIESLAGNKVQQILLNEGFGYRAQYIYKSATMLMELGGRKWLDEHSKDSGMDYEIARRKIQILPGIGPKVADCICLMSLGYLESIPIDTHIYQVARELYLSDIKEVKSVTPVIYQTINCYLRKIWGPLAGWAQAVVFCTRLKENINRKNNKNNVNKSRKKVKLQQ